MVMDEDDVADDHFDVLDLLELLALGFFLGISSFSDFLEASLALVVSRFPGF